MHHNNQQKLSTYKNSHSNKETLSIETLTREIEDFCCTETVIAIGASTGGIQALEKILVNLPLQMPPILIVQHLPKAHIQAFAKRLNEFCELNVQEAKNHQVLEPSNVYISPGHLHMEVKKTYQGFSILLNDGEKVCYHKPSVEVLFNSMAKEVKSKGFGIILTGMGRDGAQGLKAMKDSGAYTIAQNKATSTVFGMPKQAIEIGAVENILPIEDISTNLINTLKKRKSKQLSALLSS